MDATVQINGQEQAAAKCFAVATAFKGDPVKELILWMPNPACPFGREVLIIDESRCKVGIPNQSKINYSLFWGKILIQSESGSLYVSFTDPKIGGPDPQLEIVGKRITFQAPGLLSHEGLRKIELFLTMINNVIPIIRGSF